MSVQAKVIEIVSAVLGKEPGEVEPTSSLDDLEADSLDRVEIALAVEEEFDVDITEAEDQAWKTVADVVNSVLSKRPE